MQAPKADRFIESPLLDLPVPGILHPPTAPDFQPVNIFAQKTERLARPETSHATELCDQGSIPFTRSNIL
jgi:hypothetical protein